jgi:hypothetical protein
LKSSEAVAYSILKFATEFKLCQQLLPKPCDPLADWLDISHGLAGADEATRGQHEVMVLDVIERCRLAEAGHIRVAPIVVAPCVVGACDRLNVVVR